MHVYSRIELGKGALFLHLQKPISPWKGSFLFKNLHFGSVFVNFKKELFGIAS